MTVKLPINYLDTGKVARDKINNSFNEMVNTVIWYRPHIENWIWYIWNTNTGVQAEWYETEFRVDDWYIQYKTDKTNVWYDLIAIEDLKWDKGDKGDKWDTGAKGDKWDKWDKGDKWAKGDTWATWPQGATWPQWEQGIQGIQWEPWDAFQIYKTYASISAMNADKANVPEWKFVMIASTVEDPDNAKLYVKANSDFVFLTDMSWATGIQGEQWPQGIQGIQGIPWQDWVSPSATVSQVWSVTTITITDSQWTTSESIDLSDKQDTLTAWEWISIENNVISNTQTSAEWWNIEWNIEDQLDLQKALEKKQDKLTAWTDLEIIGWGESTEEISWYGSITLTEAVEDWLNSLTLYWNCIQSVLPSEYTRLDYIQSTGTQYIDTWITANFANNKIKQTAVVEFTTSSSTRELMWTNGYGFWWKSATNKIEAALGSVTVSDSALAKNVIDWTTDPTDSNRLTLNVNSNQYTSTASSFVDADYAYYIFALWIRVWSGASASFLCKAKVYSYTIAKDDEVVCDLIPCQRNSDSVLWMYDLVRWVFLTNAGTGTFIAGNVIWIPTPSTPQNIICNNGEITSSRNLFRTLWSTTTQWWVTFAVQPDGSVICTWTATWYYSWYMGRADVTPDMWTVTLRIDWVYNADYNIVVDKLHVYSGSSSIATLNWTNRTTSLAIDLSQYPTATSIRVWLKRNSNKATNATITARLVKWTTQTAWKPYKEISINGTIETVEDEEWNTATAENLLWVADYKDEQEVLSGEVTRKVWILVLTWNESGTWTVSDNVTCTKELTTLWITAKTSTSNQNIVSTHFVGSSFTPSKSINNGVYITTDWKFWFSCSNIWTTDTAINSWLRNQYANWTPVIVVYPLATETTETVTWQTLTTIEWDNTIEITQASINNLPIEANYTAVWWDIINFVNDSGYVKWPVSSWDENIAIYDWATGKIIKDSWLKVTDIRSKWIEVNVNTADSTAAKVWTTAAGNYTPTKWDFLLVNFVNWSRVSSPTLNVDGSGDINIKTWYANANLNTFALWNAADSNIKILLYYDWTYYKTRSTTNDNYSSMSQSEAEAGTVTTARTISAKELKKAIKYHAVDDTAYGSGWDWVTDIAPSQNAVYDKIESLSSTVQTTGNMKTSLANADDTTYPTTKAVADAIQSAGGGDMLASVYDPNNVWWDAFNYTNFINTPTIPSKTSDLTNDSGFITSASVPTKTSDLTNDSWFITSSYHDSTKQDTLSTQTAYTNKGGATKVPKITTNTLWQVTSITEVTITQPTKTSDLTNDSWFITSSALPTKVSDLTNDSWYLTSSTWVTSVNGSHWAVTVNEPKVSSTAPSSPTEWMIWYDTANDKLKTYNWSSWDEAWSGTDTSNTKTFYLSSTSDLTNAQAAYDWYLAGKNPIVVYNNKAYILWNLWTGYLELKSASLAWSSWNSYSQITQSYMKLNKSWDTITSISVSNLNLWEPYLSSDEDYSTPYTPQYDGSPATKKYVDDSVSVVSGDSWTTYTIKVSNSAPASWTPNSTITFVI